MSDPKVTSIHSADFQRLHRLFRALRKPYGAIEIRHFNRVYARIYAQLSPHEKRVTEQWVDELVAHIEHPKLAARVYGVV